MTGRFERTRWWARQGVLTGGAVLGVGCILMTLGAALFGLRPLVFESGSMSPTIYTGDLAISRNVDASSLRVGQIVSVPIGDGSRVTHRIVTVTHVGGDAMLRLRGDANTATDATSYRVSHADRVLFHVPRLGYVVGWLSGPMGLFALGLYAAFLVSVLLGRSPAAAPAPTKLSAEERVVPPTPSATRRAWSRWAGRRARRTTVTGGLAVAVLVGLGSGLVVGDQLTPTHAFWTDAGGVAGTSLTANLAAPLTLTCSSGGSQKTKFTWDAVSGADYVVHYDTNGSQTKNISAGTLTFTSPNNSVGTAWVVATRTFNSQLWTSPDGPHKVYTPGSC